MRRALLACLAATPLLIGSAHAENLNVAPEWSTVHVCLNKSLSSMISANESADAMFRAVRSMCDFPIGMAEMAMSRQLASSPGAVAMIPGKVDELLFAYVLRFKAAGGPPENP